MRYVSIDLETTGLDPERHHILEIAAVIDDTDHPEVPLDDLEKFHILVQSPLAWDTVLMHRELIEEIVTHPSMKDSTVKVVDPDIVLKDLSNFFFEHNLQRPTVAGKNFYSFDYPFIKLLPRFVQYPVRFCHRSIDPAFMYWEPEDAELPNLSLCLKRAGMEPSVSHRALDDAKDVIRLVRYWINLYR